MVISDTIKPKYFTLEQLSEYSNFSVPTLRRYIRNKRLPIIRIRGGIRVDIDRFDQWMNQHCMVETSEKEHMDQVVKDILKDFDL